MKASRIATASHACNSDIGSLAETQDQWTSHRWPIYTLMLENLIECFSPLNHASFDYPVRRVGRHSGGEYIVWYVHRAKPQLLDCLPSSLGIYLLLFASCIYAYKTGRGTRSPTLLGINILMLLLISSVSLSFTHLAAVLIVISSTGFYKLSAYSTRSYIPHHSPHRMHTIQMFATPDSSRKVHYISCKPPLGT